MLEHRGVHLDLLRHTVSLNGQPVDLTSREYVLLEIFMQNPRTDTHPNPDFGEDLGLE